MWVVLNSLPAPLKLFINIDMSTLHLISSVCSDPNDAVGTTGVYHTPVVNNSAEWWRTRDIYLERWRHVIQMYTDWGTAGVITHDPVGASVYAMGDTWWDITPYQDLDTSYDVIYLVTQPDVPPLDDNIHLEYITNWSIFCRMNLHWRSIQNSMPVLSRVPYHSRITPDFQFKYWAANTGIRIVVV